MATRCPGENPRDPGMYGETKADPKLHHQAQYEKVLDPAASSAETQHVPVPSDRAGDWRIQSTALPRPHCVDDTEASVQGDGARTPWC